jgi:hypothetical protein
MMRKRIEDYDFEVGSEASYDLEVVIKIHDDAAAAANFATFYDNYDCVYCAYCE